MPIEELADARWDDPPVGRRDHVVGAAATLAVVVAWWALAAWRPTVTYHLAPVFAAAVWPVALRRGGPLRVAPADARPAAIAAGMLTLLASVALWRLDLLRGPTLWDSGHAMAEIVPAIVVGTVGGYRYARCGASG